MDGLIIGHKLMCVLRENQKNYDFLPQKCPFYIVHP